MRTMFGSTDLNGGYWPFKGLFVSVLSHSSVLVGTTLFAILNTPPPPRLTTRAVMTIDLRETGDMPLLPALDDGHPNVNSPGSSPKELSYPGPQRIRSDVHEPTNRIQTLLQPQITNPPILEIPAPLPNIVSIATARPIELALTGPMPWAAEPPPLVAAPIEAPKIDRLSVDPKPAAIHDSEDLLALTPLPPPPQPSVAIPAGEARARFSVSPTPNLGASGAVPGASPGSDGSAGAGTGSSKNPFAGITIIGGLGTTTPSASASDAAVPAPVQTSWGATIQSTEDSGGGLPRFGVFSGEIHTAYLDMRRTIADEPHDWIFEFGAEPDPTANAARPWRKFVLPFPIIREQPVLPSELVRKYPRRMIIVYGVISVDGKLEEMSVKESPDPLLNKPALSALSKWVFKPAQTDGKTVAAKMLVGIPLR